MRRHVAESFRAKSSLRSVFRACRRAPGQVRVGKRVRSVRDVQKGLDFADELGWQSPSLAANEALGAASSVGANGHEAVLPEFAEHHQATRNTHGEGAGQRPTLFVPFCRS